MPNQKFNKSDLHIIHAISNLHVGSGDNNFGIIDNQVQRDIITKRPTINSSSLKGALRESFQKHEDESQFIKYVFGSHPVNDRGNDSQKGAYTFLASHLLVMPLRANTKAFFRATSPEIIKEFLSMVEIFEIELKELEALKKLINEHEPKEGSPIVFEELKETIIEDLDRAEYKEFDTSTLSSLLGENIALLHDADFNRYANSLPVIARNHLEDGVSQNLWYEEVVPRESRFYFVTTKPSNLNSEDSDRIKRFEGMLHSDKMVQIGANATIGYGYCSIKKVSSDE